MTQDEKSILLKDLCSRLPYGVKLKHIPSGEDTVLEMIGYGVIDGDIHDVIENFKPYLRPMSSMTEEEKEEVSKLGVCYDGAFHNDIYDVGIYMEEAFAAISWLLERHFDINYLIHKGLALEAPTDMYNLRNDYTS